MKPRLFVTGATGLVGRALRRHLDPDDFGHVAFLARAVPALTDTAEANDPRVKWIQGDLLDERSYAHALEQADVVLHLAALTGAAPAAEHFRINMEGTRRLIQASERAGVRRFILVSTIAAKFEVMQGYSYASSKRAAEDLLRTSRLAYAIVRPTLVLAPDAPVWQKLSRLASVPVVPVLGTGRVQVQPICVDDVAAALLVVVRERGTGQDELDLGGPEVLTMEEFLCRIHSARRQRRPHVIHVPVRPLYFVLAALERVIGTRLPVTAGQLAPFLNDSTASANDGYPRQRTRMKDIGTMLAHLTATN